VVLLKLRKGEKDSGVRIDRALCAGGVPKSLNAKRRPINLFLMESILLHEIEHMVEITVCRR
jgi:hypothetical protein